ncbi:X2-like carbohydrate binding domain-containing protein [Paenibacillus hexagrammi]|uniref:S-layer homology domain-containing protein n=1 Tax=Paenibacillus hexagrammi TaxID=2908839 RepID=A0ABY3SM61_9BACL|nr:X2-like carbohydrate binding domain-containing protein [Paenibacillus sp. YPD9-1]UJF34210.1 S-layer homology domain-containing protein [Paenibacillus sp. YPD9-1]
MIIRNATRTSMILLMGLLLVFTGTVPFLPGIQKAYAADVDLGTAVTIDIDGDNASINHAVSLPYGKTGYLYSDPESAVTLYRIIDKVGNDIAQVNLNDEMGAAAGSPESMKVIYLKSGNTLIAWESSGDHFIVLDENLNVSTHRVDFGVSDSTELTPVELSNGNIVFMWYSSDSKRYSTQIYQPDGSAVGALVDLGLNRDATEGDPSLYSIASNGNGSYMIVSRHFVNGDASTTNPFDRAVLYNNDGTERKELFKLKDDANAENSNSFPLQVIGLPDHNYAVLFVAGDQLLIQKYDDTGSTVGLEVNTDFVNRGDTTAGLLASASDHFFYYVGDASCLLNAQEIPNDGSLASGFNPVLPADEMVVGLQTMLSGFETKVGVFDPMFNRFVLHGAADAGATISPTTATFDKNTADTTTGHYQDVTTMITPNGNTFVDVTLNGTTIGTSNYSESNGTVTIKKEYLATLGTGNQVFTLDMSGGTDPTLTVDVSDTTITVQDSTISPTTATFDKNTADTTAGHYEDVTTALTPNGNTLVDVTLNGTTIGGTNYTESNGTVTIAKEYLATLGTGNQVFTLDMSGGADPTLTVDVSDTTPTIQDSTINPTTATFDKNTADISAGHYQDVTTMNTPNGNTFVDVTLNGTTIGASNYSESNGTVTIKKEYLATLGTGNQVFTLDMSGGTDPTLTVDVSDTTITVQDSTINPTTATFDKNTADTTAGHYEDVTTALTPNGNTISSVVNGLTPLIYGTDYTVSGSTVTINKSYLATQSVGTTTLTFNFNAGATQTLTITVGDTTPTIQDSTISPTTATFDKNTADTSAGHYEDVATTLTPNGNTISSVVNGLTPLIYGTDYTVSGSTVTINKSYLAAQSVGTTTLTFNFNAGATQTLTITVGDTTPTVQDSTISPTTATFDKNTADTSAGHYDDVTTTLTPNGNTISSVVNGLTPLIYGTDYTVSGSTVTINKSYLAAQSVGTTTLTFNFNAGATQTLTIMVSDTTPVIIPISVLSAPTLQLAAQGNTQVQLSWSPVETATGYKIYQSTTSNVYGPEIQSVAASVYSYDVTGLNNDTTYYYVVKAFNNDGESLYSNEVAATPRASVPEAPTNVVATAGKNQATVTFSIPADGGSSITGYEITTLPDNAKIQVTGSPAVITGLSNGVAYKFTVKAINQVGNSQASDPSNEVTPKSSSGSQSGGSAASSPSDQKAQVLVNGKAQNLGTVVSSKVNNQTVTTIAIDANQLKEKLASEGQKSVVTIPVTTKSDIVIGELNGQMVKDMEQKEAVVEVKTDDATYTLPAGQINISSLSKTIGAQTELQDIKVHIAITKPSEQTTKLVEQAANREGLTLVSTPVDFNVTATYGDKTVNVSQFNAYVERSIVLQDGVDASKITTAVVVDEDGTVRHVPTQVVKTNGKYTAKVKSLTNSTYSVVYHPVQFNDVTNHWAEAAVNDMGSRLVIGGIGSSLFNPDQDITRAEFAAILVRGLGLKLETSPSAFADVHKSDWYSAAVQTAYEHKLISGFEDNTFRPTDKISREQAMTMIAKAMSLTGLQANSAGNEKLLTYTDASNVSSWAAQSVASCLGANIISGRNSDELAPKANISRAEVAVIVQRLLRQSGLIN